jgi:cytoskeletal protein RodZ
MLNKTISLLLLGLLLSACGPAATVQPTPDIDTIHTAAAQTVVAEFTQTAMAAPPTAAPTDTQEPTATSDASGPTTEAPQEATVEIPLESSPTPVTCDDASFDPASVDVTVPDGTEMTPGQDFVKTWKIKNTGTCTWGSGYSVIYAFGEKMAGVAEPLTTAVAPNEEVEVSVRLKAPQEVGQYSSTWRMANANNSPFGETFYVLIVVR